jgi:gas vesicle protein
MEDNKLSYFLFGLGMGVAIGVLFAPRSGEETREILKTKAGEGREYLRRKGEDVRESASDLVSRGREAFEGQRENLSAALDAGRQAYRQAMAGGQGKAPEGASGA